MVVVCIHINIIIYYSYNAKKRSLKVIIINEYCNKSKDKYIEKRMVAHVVGMFDGPQR